MKQISLHLVLFTIILALLLTGCTQMDPSTLVVKPEVATRIDKLLTQITRDGTFTGSVLIAQRNAWARTTRVIGVVWFLLIAPFVIIFIRYLDNRMGWEIMLPFTLILIYMLLEFLLDIVFKRQFRSKRTTHVLYLVLEYSALFSLIWIAFNVSQTLGYLVLITFWVLQASMIYFYWEKIRIRQLVTR